MQRKRSDIALSSYDDIFSSEAERQESSREQVQEIPLEELHPFKDHPFKILDDEAMQRTTESIEKYGVLTPAIARPLPDGGYELISGHRRKHAAEMAGLKTLPVIVREMDDDAATILMVDSNLQREELLPSERAYAYKMKLEAIKHQGERSDRTSTQIGRKLESAELVGKEAGDSRNQVRRYIRLTHLIPELLDMVDQKKISFNPAVELSYLSPEEQKSFMEAMEYTGGAPPTLSQAQRLKKFSQSKMCTFEAMCAVMSEDKKSPMDRIVFDQDTLRKYFPKTYSTQQMQETIIKLLDQWQKKRDRNQAL